MPQTELDRPRARGLGSVERRASAAAGTLDVLVALTESDLRARYGRGGFRLVKWLLDPFALVGVYLLLVSFVIYRPGIATGLSLACAVIPFQLIMLAVTNGLGSVAFRSSIILNMGFRRTLIPLAGALTESAAFASSLLLVVLMMAAYGIAPTLAVLWLPLVLGANVLLAVASAYGASIFGLWYPDLRALAISAVRALFFLAPGLVALADIQGRAHDLLKLNPLTGLFEAYRAVFLYGHAPSAWQILYPICGAVALLAVFLPVYTREQRQFAKVL